MKALFYDYIQDSNAPESLKSPSLADTTQIQEIFIDLGQVRTFDSVGIGNTEENSVTINGELINLDPTEKNGLYHFDNPITASVVHIVFQASTKVGRIAIGRGFKLGAAPAREPGFWSTSNPRKTLSGQVIAGVGGVTGRSLQVDFRYKVDREIFDEIALAYPLQLGRGYPIFISFPTATEQNRFPWKRFYGVPDLKWVFQSSVNKFLYSKKLNFTEAF